MTSRVFWMVAGLAALVGLSACGEKPQAAGQRFAGTAAHAGVVGTSPYVSPGWKAGDATSWDTHMRSRTQSGQNEYVRSGGQ